MTGRTIVVAVCLLLAGASAVAVARQVSRDGTTLTYTAGGEMNQVLVGFLAPSAFTPAPEYIFKESGQRLAPASGCTVSSDGDTVHCPAEGVTKLVVELGGGRDNLRTADIAIPMIADGGPGKDTLTSWGGSDRLTGGPGDDTLNGQEGNDRLRGGPGNDTLYAAAVSPKSRQGKDRLDCGPGNDRAYVDKTDVVSKNCEDVTRFKVR
jgi:Ca2+-binding RTX toxin-like protein